MSEDRPDLLAAERLPDVLSVLDRVAVEEEASVGRHDALRDRRGVVDAAIPVPAGPLPDGDQVRSWPEMVV
jgi:hypothetical protein